VLAWHVGYDASLQLCSKQLLLLLLLLLLSTCSYFLSLGLAPTAAIGLVLLPRLTGVVVKCCLALGFAEYSCCCCLITCSYVLSLGLAPLHPAAYSAGLLERGARLTVLLPLLLPHPCLLLCYPARLAL
jgi:hypothetical protein